MSNLQIYRTTTPVLIFKIKNPDFDMSSIETCHVAIENKYNTNSLIIDDPMIDLEEKTIKVRLTQEQTQKYSVGVVKIQLKMKLNTDDVVSSSVIEGNILEILEEEFIELITTPMIIDAEIISPDNIMDVELEIGHSAVIPQPEYEGPYEVTPTIEGFTLETKDKTMADDLSVLSIPYQEVSNPQGGKLL